MTRLIRVALFLTLLAVWTGGCKSKPKDHIPTQIQAPPADPPAAGDADIFPKKK